MMGVFNSIMIECPHCKAQVEVSGQISVKTEVVKSFIDKGDYE